MGKDTKIEEIKKDLEETQKIMVKNIDNLITRGEKLEKLEDTTQELREEAHYFVRGATELKKSLQSRQIRLTLVLVGAVIGVVWGLYSGSWGLGLIAYGGVGAGLGYAVGWLVSAVQQKFKPFSLFNSASGEHHSPDFLSKPTLEHSQAYELPKDLLLQYHAKPQAAASEVHSVDQDLQSKVRLPKC